MKLKHALSALIISLGSIAQAQDGPSYEETVAFLGEKFESDIIRRDQDERQNLFMELDRCQFVFVERKTTFTGHIGITASTQIASFSELDPSRVEIENQNFYMFTKNNVPSVAMVWATDNATPMAGNFSRDNCNGAYRDIYDDDKFNRFINIPKSQRLCNADTDALRNSSVWIPGRHWIKEPRSDNAPRVQRALQHLIRLCGGSEELF